MAEGSFCCLLRQSYESFFGVGVVYITAKWRLWLFSMLIFAVKVAAAATLPNLLPSLPTFDSANIIIIFESKNKKEEKF